MATAGGITTAAGDIAIAIGTEDTGAGDGGGAIIATTGDGAAIAITTTIVATIVSAGVGIGARTRFVSRSAANGRHSR